MRQKFVATMDQITPRFYDNLIFNIQMYEDECHLT